MHWWFDLCHACKKDDAEVRTPFQNPVNSRIRICRENQRRYHKDVAVYCFYDAFHGLHPYLLFPTASHQLRQYRISEASPHHGLSVFDYKTVPHFNQAIPAGSAVMRETCSDYLESILVSMHGLSGVGVFLPKCNYGVHPLKVRSREKTPPRTKKFLFSLDQYCPMEIVAAETVRALRFFLAVSGMGASVNS